MQLYDGCGYVGSRCLKEIEMNITLFPNVIFILLFFRYDKSKKILEEKFKNKESDSLLVQML